MLPVRHKDLKPCNPKTASARFSAELIEKGVLCILELLKVDHSYFPVILEHTLYFLHCYCSMVKKPRMDPLHLPSASSLSLSPSLFLEHLH